MQIINLQKNDSKSIDQVAQLLLTEFAHAWESYSVAVSEIEETLEVGKISKIAITESDEVVGWIAGTSNYRGHVWELHPLVVKSSHQGKGVGRKLVYEFEESARELGGLTVYLGADDEDCCTSLGGVDLYPNVIQNMLDIKTVKTHPLEFYKKVGYSVVGVLPDANGLGKPDIFMAKKISDLTYSKIKQEAIQS